MAIELPTEEILARGPGPGELDVIGRSREGREVRGRVFGGGPARVSLIGGCHADEPVGPEMLARLASYFGSLAAADPVLTAATWFVVPHVNPDGAARNATWAGRRIALKTADGRTDEGFCLGSYLREVVRELPGDDVEFGFPRSADDLEARPENRAVADFLRPGAPFVVHGTFHGMAFAPGPWFLLEAAWAERTADLRHRLRRRVRAMGYRPFDVDRGGEKGFSRIDEGFSTRPDSGAMRDYFLARDDPETAARFRPSSMELVRSLGGDPLTFVSENPLFLLPAGSDAAELKTRLAEAAATADPAVAARLADRLGVRPMPLGDQMRLQLAFLNEALRTIEA